MAERIRYYNPNAVTNGNGLTPETPFNGSAMINGWDIAIIGAGLVAGDWLRMYVAVDSVYVWRRGIRAANIPFNWEVNSYTPPGHSGPCKPYIWTNLEQIPMTFQEVDPLLLPSENAAGRTPKPGRVGYTGSLTPLPGSKIWHTPSNFVGLFPAPGAPNGRFGPQWDMPNEWNGGAPGSGYYPTSNPIIGPTKAYDWSKTGGNIGGNVVWSDGPPETYYGGQLYTDTIPYDSDGSTGIGTADNWKLLAIKDTRTNVKIHGGRFVKCNTAISITLPTIYTGELGEIDIDMEFDAVFAPIVMPGVSPATTFPTEAQKRWYKKLRISGRALNIAGAFFHMGSGGWTGVYDYKITDTIVLGSNYSVANGGLYYISWTYSVKERLFEISWSWIHRAQYCQGIWLDGDGNPFYSETCHGALHVHHCIATLCQGGLFIGTTTDQDLYHDIWLDGIGGTARKSPTGIVSKDNGDELIRGNSGFNIIIRGYDNALKVNEWDPFNQVNGTATEPPKRLTNKQSVQLRNVFKGIIAKGNGATGDRRQAIRWRNNANHTARTLISTCAFSGFGYNGNTAIIVSEYGQEDSGTAAAGVHQTDRTAFLVDNRSGDFDAGAFVDSVMPNPGIDYVDVDPVTAVFDNVKWDNLARKKVRTLVWGPPSTMPTLESTGISAP